MKEETIRMELNPTPPIQQEKTAPILRKGLEDRVAVVTGGGRGIGAATASELLSKGARVMICARTEIEVQAWVAQMTKKYGPGRAAGMTLDLTASGASARLLDEAESVFSEVASVLVNNAALGYAFPFIESSPETLSAEWDRIEAVNVRAPLLLSHEFMRRLSKAKTSGAIVNLSSLGGIRSTDKFPGLGPYAMSKFAIVGMTEALAVEGRPHSIRVNAVAPGAVDTEMLRKAAPHLKTDTKPEDVARLIRFLCDDSESSTISGTILEIHSNL
jgi:NAD(P)-dependent dehydrogenase (short-subunit alcohol dehydrogenase family)